MGTINGTASGATTTTAFGKVGSAFSLSSNGDGITVANSTSHAFSSSFSAAGWVNPTSASPSTTQTLVAKGAPTTTLALADFSYYNLNNISAAAAGGHGGTVFDGRYLYIIPAYTGAGADASTFVRYDTQSSFTSASSYSTFDSTALTANAKNYYGGAFDGRYIYFTPYVSSANAGRSIFLRYDTQGAFNSTSSWTTYDVTALNAAFVGFASAAFDGRYVYFGPTISSAQHGYWLRYDTQGSGFNVAGSWTSYKPFGLQVVSTAGFDGRYVYWSEVGGFQTYRYDTYGSFTSAGSWTASTAIPALPGAFVYDGKYMYIADYWTTYKVRRYDPTTSFTTAGNFTAFDVTTVNAAATYGIYGGNYDGRYLYFISGTLGGYDGYMLKYDTTGNFTTAANWQYLNFKNLDGANGLSGYRWLAFDGRYLYAVPYYSGVYGYGGGRIVRYDTDSGAQNSFRLNSNFYSGDGGNFSQMGPSAWIRTALGFYNAFSTSLLSSAWHHLAATYDGTTLSLYVDGTSVASRTAPGSLTSNTNSLTIGNYAGGPGSIAGYIDEVLVANTTFSSSDITAISSTYANYGVCKY